MVFHTGTPWGHYGMRGRDEDGWGVVRGFEGYYFLLICGIFVWARIILKGVYMLEKGLTVISVDELQDYLTEHLCSADRQKIERIVNRCLDKKASAVFIFIRFRNGNINCEAFMPIFNKEDLFEKYNKNYKKPIGKSINLGAKIMKTKKELDDKEAWRVIINRAVRVGGWSEDCTMLVFCKKEYK